MVQTDRQTDKGNERERHADRGRDRERKRGTNRQTSKQREPLVHLFFKAYTTDVTPVKYLTSEIPLSLVSSTFHLFHTSFIRKTNRKTHLTQSSELHSAVTSPGCLDGVTVWLKSYSTALTKQHAYGMTQYSKADII